MHTRPTPLAALTMLPRALTAALLLTVAATASAQDRLPPLGNYGNPGNAGSAAPQGPATFSGPGQTVGSPAAGPTAKLVTAPTSPSPAATAMSPDAIAKAEQQDFGIAPTGQLHAGAMHGPTPTSIPGGRVIGTRDLVALLSASNKGALVFDVLGSNEQLPGALPAAAAHQPGSFDDAVQRGFGQALERVSQGQRDRPMVFYCASIQCWMSYNAALRAIRLGYSQVLWYRGGIEAWKAAQQPVQMAQAGPGR
jgi:PQQ-dependent catabolism-associated CXXCW motif protein